MAEHRKPPRPHRQRGLVGLLACVSAGIYGGIAILSWRFGVAATPQQRPVLLTLGLFGLLFFLYLFGVRIARRLGDDRQGLQLIVVGSLLFRVTMLFSVPILEIDIYRYIWGVRSHSTDVFC